MRFYESDRQPCLLMALAADQGWILAGAINTWMHPVAYAQLLKPSWEALGLLDMGEGQV